MLKHGNAAVYFSNYLRLSRLEVKEKLQWFGSGMLMMPGSCRYWYLQLICEEMNTTLTGSHRLLMVTVGLLPVASGGSADMHEKSSNCRNLVTTSFTIRTWFLCGFSFVLLPQSRRLCFCKRWPVSCIKCSGNAYKAMKEMSLFILVFAEMERLPYEHWAAPSAVCDLCFVLMFVTYGKPTQTSAVSCRELPHHAIREPADSQRHKRRRGTVQMCCLQPRHSGSQNVLLCRPPAHPP